MNTFYIENLGCAKNQVDAEVIITSLTNAGFSYSESSENADIIIVNTCGFINSAKEESIDVTLEFRKIYPTKKIILAGCLAQRYEDQVFLPEIDGIFGNKAPDKITQVMNDVIKGKKPVFIPVDNGTEVIRKKLLSFKGSSYVKIAEGCNNRCTYCAIPLIRGDVKSRLREDIITEIKDLIAKGVFEINLIAQDLSSFGIDRKSSELYNLLKDISKLPGDFWIRLLYIHPDRFPEKIIEIMKDDPRILPYFDLPFQHGSQRILRKMGRKGNSKIYLELLDNIRTNLPNAVIRSTFLVGFPGENKKDFIDLLNFQKEASFDWLGAFTYSREEGTPAYSLRGAFSQKIQNKTFEKRKNKILELQKEITHKNMDRFVGQKLKLFVEEAVMGEDLYLARSYAHAPEVDGLVVLSAADLTPGLTVNSKIIKRNGLDLEAVILE